MLTVQEVINILQEAKPNSPVYYEEDNDTLSSVNIAIDEKGAVYFCKGELL